MDDLIARLERLTEPSRELDLEIAIAVWGRPGVIVMRQSEDDGIVREHTYWEYTASIDDALTLVPEGLTWQVTGRVKADGDFFADVDVDKRCDSAPTPAIALCIAALKARLAARYAAGEPQQAEMKA